eukprot:6168917-Amphidinium_carterae.3
MAFMRGLKAWRERETLVRSSVDRPARKVSCSLFLVRLVGKKTLRKVAMGYFLLTCLEDQEVLALACLEELNLLVALYMANQALRNLLLFQVKHLAMPQLGRPLLGLPHFSGHCRPGRHPGRDRSSPSAGKAAGRPRVLGPSTVPHASVEPNKVLVLKHDAKNRASAEN